MKREKLLHDAGIDQQCMKQARSGMSLNQFYALWDEAMATDVSEAVPALELPVYFFHGRHDYTV